MTKLVLVLARGVIADALDLGSTLLARGAASVRAPEEKHEPTHVRVDDEELAASPTEPAPPPIDPLSLEARAMLDTPPRVRTTRLAAPLSGSIEARAAGARAWR